MSAVAIVVLVVVCATLAGALVYQRRSRTLTPSARRILFPFVGRSLSERTLDAALRLAQAEGATLVPTYLALVPLHLQLETPLPAQCDAALPLLEVIEQRAAGQHIPVDARIAAGRTYRHALARLFEQERFDRIVVAAGTEGTDGLSADDVAWLLEHAPGEVVVLRPPPKKIALSRTRGAHVRARRPRAAVRD